LAGVDGAKPGLMMPANASPQMPPWTIAQPPHADPDVAQAVARGTRQCVAFNCYSSVLTVREGKASALNNELKYYAPGVGQILNTPMVFSHHKDVEELVNLIQLTPRGLAEISAEVLKLDRHARVTARGTYASISGSQAGTVSILLHAQAVSKAYRQGDLETRVLSEVSLEIERGKTTSLVGVSGSGKSTLISLLAGLMTPDRGRVLFDGQDLNVLDDTGRASLRANRIGVALQNSNLIPFLTAVENVQLAIDLAGGDASATRADDLIDQLGLETRRHHLPRRLSGGEAQRVALAVALANEPDLLLADEVVGELDSTTAARVMEVVFDASRERGLAVLW